VAAVFSAGVVVLASVWDDGSAAPAGDSGESGSEAFGAGELSEVESPPDGDDSSALARPLPNPTATQADRTNAATVNRNHQ
jgi:hypothetical protein